MKYYIFLICLTFSLNLFGDIVVSDSNFSAYTKEELMHIFQDHGIDPYHITNQEDTILHSSAKKGHVNVVRLALAFGIDPLMPNRAGDLPLHIATSKNNEEIVELLIEAGTPLQVANKKKQTPYHVALKNHCDELIHLFLTLGYQPHEDPLVDEMIAEGYSLDEVDSKGQNALHKAVVEGRLELIPKLIEAGLSIDSQIKNGQTALMLAAQKGKLDAVKLLLEMGANVAVQDDKSNTALFYAAIKDYYYIAKILLEKDHTHVNDLNAKGAGIIHYAAARGNFLMMSLLLTYEANPSLRTKPEYISGTKNWSQDDWDAMAEFGSIFSGSGRYLYPEVTPLAVVEDLHPTREDLKTLLTDHNGIRFFWFLADEPSIAEYLKN